MEEEIIDTVNSYELEQGDRIEYMEPEDGTWQRDTVQSIEDYGSTVSIHLEDRDEPLEVDAEQRFDVYGYTTVEV